MPASRGIILALCVVLVFLMFVNSPSDAAIFGRRLKRQPPTFIDWTAPRMGATPYGVPGHRPGYGGSYGPFGVGLVGIAQGLIFGGR
ncbi:hypothetical protein DdX_15562 [Ditylenchus destructor]|uniref:Uncharacterized protein n=1 Tax=Ditylenchus destructor TaxID=166010 RepID=A0AAD4MR72_9BILA|nr:hypothetical protein DdX_15562 [Ditylenchus destructor]